MGPGQGQGFGPYDSTANVRQYLSVVKLRAIGPEPSEVSQLLRYRRVRRLFGDIADLNG